VSNCGPQFDRDTIAVVDKNGYSAFREIDGQTDLTDPASDVFERAYMFAAAPEMLDALKIARDQIETLTGKPASFLNSVIAKATGGQ